MRAAAPHRNDGPANLWLVPSLLNATGALDGITLGHLARHVAHTPRSTSRSFSQCMPAPRLRRQQAGAASSDGAASGCVPNAPMSCRCLLHMAASSQHHVQQPHGSASNHAVTHLRTVTDESGTQQPWPALAVGQLPASSCCASLTCLAAHHTAPATIQVAGHLPFRPLRAGATLCACPSWIHGDRLLFQYGFWSQALPGRLAARRAGRRPMRLRHCCLQVPCRLAIEQMPSPASPCPRIQLGHSTNALGVLATHMGPACCCQAAPSRVNRLLVQVTLAQPRTRSRCYRMSQVVPAPRQRSHRLRVQALIIGGCHPITALSGVASEQLHRPWPRDHRRLHRQVVAAACCWGPVQRARTFSSLRRTHAATPPPGGLLGRRTFQ